MKKFWIIILLFSASFAPNHIALSQTKPETLPEYVIIEKSKIIPIPLNIKTNQLIEQYVAYYQGRGKQIMEVAIYRYGMHERMIRRIFNEEGVPEDLSWIHQAKRMWDGGLRVSDYLPTITKDAVVTKVRGSFSPRPLWLFTPDVAKKYDLKKTKYLDETRSFEKATRAMAQYLKFLYEKYDKDWELAVGAYESGEGIVDLAIKKAKVKEYWTIYKYLPSETRNFVPNLLATILISKNKDSYGFGHIRFAPQLNYETLRIAPSISLLKIAQFGDTSVDYLRYLNPEFISNVTPPSIYYIRVPMGKGEIIAENLRKSINR